MKINNLIPVYGNSNLKRDPKTQALLNCNYDKLNVSKTLNSLNNKYNELENKLNTIDKTMNEIKNILNVISKQDNR